MSIPPNGGLILQGLTINGQSIPDPTIQAPTGLGDAATTKNIEASTVGAVPAGPKDTWVL